MNTYLKKKFNLLQKILQLAYCLTGCLAGTCFDDFKTPNVLHKFFVGDINSNPAVCQ